MERATKKAFKLFALANCLLFAMIGRVVPQSCGPGISFESQAQVNNFPAAYPGCTQIIGACSITGGNITDLSPLSQITSFGGHLNIINLSNLTSLNGLHNVTSIGGALTIDNTPALTSLNGLSSLTSIGSYLTITNTNLTNLSGLNNLASVGTHLEIYSNPMLTNLSGLNSVSSTGGQLFISNNPALTNVDGLSSLGAIAGPLRINNNLVLANLNGLSNLTSLGGSTIELLVNPALTSLSGLGNIDYTTIGSWSGTYLSIVANNNLSLCSVQSLCDYIENGGVVSGISNNAVGCNSVGEVEAGCTIDYIWNGTGNWNDPTKWTPNGVPDASDNATINSGTVTLTSNTDVNNLTINGGTTLNGNYHLDIGGNLELYGSLVNHGNVTIEGTFYCNGGLIGDGTETGVVTVSGLSTLRFAYVRKKTLVLDGGANAKLLSISNGGSVSNSVGQIYTTNCDGPGDCGIVDAFGGGGTFENFGTLIHSNSVAVYFTIEKFISFYNTGIVQVSDGEAMELQTSGTFTNDNTLIVNGTFYNPGVLNNNGVLKGVGTIDQISTINNNSGSSVAPGISPGKLTINGSFNLGSGTYNCEINGTGQGTTYDWLAISGTATLTNASLVVDWGSYSPSPGSFTIMTFGSRVGEFASTTIPPVAGMTFDVIYSANSVILMATQPTCLSSGIIFTTQTQVDDFPNNYPGCTEIEGNVSIQGNEITNLAGLSAITEIGGRLSIACNTLPNLNGLNNLTSIGALGSSIGGNKNLSIGPANLLIDISALSNLTYVGESVIISSLENLSTLNGLQNINEINGSFLLDWNPGLNDISAMQNVVMNKNVTIFRNPISSLNGLQGAVNLTGSLAIRDNDNLVNLTGLSNLQSVGSILYIDDNNSISDLSALSNLDYVGSLQISNNDNLSSLSGLGNATIAGEILAIVDSENLSMCEVQSVCDYLDIVPPKPVTISNNASGCNTRAQVEAACLALLPIELIRFSAEKNLDGVVLNWETLTETHHDYFQVEHSTERAVFTALGKIAAASSQSNVPKAYQFIHEQPPVGNNYYRLKQIDLDGGYEYSHTISVEITGKNLHATISPNPNHGHFTLNIQNPPRHPMTARLLDSCGWVVWEALVEEGTQAMALEGQWPDGLYVLQLYNGQETWTEKVVVR